MLMNNPVFGKFIVKAIKKKEELFGVKTKSSRNKISILLTIEMKKVKLVMNKLVYLGLSLLKIS